MNAPTTSTTRVEPARQIWRFLAFGIDATIATCLVLVALMLFSSHGLPQIGRFMVDFERNQAAAGTAGLEEREEFEAEATAIGQGVVGALVVMMLIPFGFALLVARHGGTPGKALFQMTVRDLGSGQFPRFGQALARESLRLMHLLCVAVPGVAVALSIAVSTLVLLDMTRSRLLQTWYDRLTRAVIVAPVPAADDD